MVGHEGADMARNDLPLHGDDTVRSSMGREDPGPAGHDDHRRGSDKPATNRDAKAAALRTPLASTLPGGACYLLSKTIRCRIVWGIGAQSLRELAHFVERVDAALARVQVALDLHATDEVELVVIERGKFLADFLALHVRSSPSAAEIPG